MISFGRPWIAAATATVRRCRVTSSRRGWPRRRYGRPALRWRFRAGVLPRGDASSSESPGGAY